MADGFVSEAQRKKWGQLLSEGRVTQAQYDARAENSPDVLPPRAAPRRRTVGASRAAETAKVPRY